MRCILKVFNGKKLIDRYASGSKIRFGMKLRFNPKVSGSRNTYFLKFIYGKAKDRFGRMVPFTNEGTYTNKKDLMKAYNAFKELLPVDFV